MAGKTPPGSVDIAQLNRIEERLQSLEKSLKDVLKGNTLATPTDLAKPTTKEEPIVPLTREQTDETGAASDEQTSQETDKVTTSAVSKGRTDEMEIMPRPGEEPEVKLMMNVGDIADYSGVGEWRSIEPRRSRRG